MREAAESVLRDGETLTSLIETSARETIRRRRVQEEFIARGLRSREDAERTGIYLSAESVHSELQRRLDARRKSILGLARRRRRSPMCPLNRRIAKSCRFFRVESTRSDENGRAGYHPSRARTGPISRPVAAPR